MLKYIDAVVDAPPREGRLTISTGTFPSSRRRNRSKRSSSTCSKPARVASPSSEGGAVHEFGKGKAVADLECEQTPEAIMLSTMTDEGDGDRSEREVLVPWLKFLWEALGRS